ncbi:ubiquitin-fold modifier 1 isoform X1 [Eptesicus fuscus]|uniref:ubiquitin-fold modifier 1 isoform X1 n=1 Tax=Eptesicus fuscus TaxID=29078 RepID=UPI002403E30C|nr:ubiquitin-fold modifier 1 isoform X1 [Eptesicus fuscus]
MSNLHLDSEGNTALQPGGPGNSSTQQRGAAAARTPSPSLTRFCDRLRRERGTGGPTPGPRDARRRGPAGPTRRRAPGPAGQETALAPRADRRPPARSPPPPPPGARPGRGSRGRGARARPGERGEGTWRVTWTPAMARAVRSPAGASPRGRRARRSPRRPGALLGPRPEASGPGRPSSGAAPLPARAGPPRAPGPPPPRGPLSRGRPAPLTRSRPPSGRGAEARAGRASGRERAGASAGSATRAAPLPQRRRRPGPRCRCQLVGRTLSMRARRPHPGARGGEPARPPAARPSGGLGPGPAGRRCPSEVGEGGCVEGMIARESGISSQKGNTSVGSSTETH